ncbi:hypothetical protein NEOLEDRAFT_708855 [Neolentinus lepideus HHB14362 ss-1]|uniref:Uncharacterized protein n=1 Tax=Neolentinus lepideus HHB14362 ss-1 TaxID=1314782 RepID=A0A165Q7B4_9AGAM|nr:hypothetical protein NEOLEDRAFT_708855 [Neolentinus lepideus HHB14362 ss-1]
MVSMTSLTMLKSTLSQVLWPPHTSRRSSATSLRAALSLPRCSRWAPLALFRRPSWLPLSLGPRAACIYRYSFNSGWACVACGLADNPYHVGIVVETGGGDVLILPRT